MIERLFSLYFSIPDRLRARLRKLIPPPLLDFLVGIYFNPHKLRPLPPVYHLYRNLSFGQLGEDLVLDRLLRSRSDDPERKGFYVDVGAYHPVSHSVTALLYLKGWSGIAIDFSKESQKLFKKHRARDTFIKGVVGASHGETVSFFLAAEHGDFSLVNSKYPASNGKSREIRAEQISLDVVLRENGVSKVDVLNLDIEGAEFEVLQSLDLDYFCPLVIVVEIHEPDIEGVLRNPVTLLLQSMGYTLVASTIISHFFVRSSEKRE